MEARKCCGANLKSSRLPRMLERRRNSLRRPAGCEDVLKLDAVGVGKEDRVVTGRVLWVLSWSVENGNSEIEESFMKSIDRDARRGSEGKVVKAG